jgi:hypothetical protein
MTRRRGAGLAGALLMAAWPVAAQEAVDAFLAWPKARAEQITRSARVDGRVGGLFDLRVTSTDQSYNYKLRATWLSDEVVRATARLTQLEEGLTTAQTKQLVDEASRPGSLVLLVEIDPREGSGVIPLEWVATLRDTIGDAAERRVRGVSRPELRKIRSLSGGSRRDYAYEAFWMEFPLADADGAALFNGRSETAELSVRIHSKEGRVTLPVPSSLRMR